MLLGLVAPDHGRGTVLGAAARRPGRLPRPRRRADRGAGLLPRAERGAEPRRARDGGRPRPCPDPGSARARGARGARATDRVRRYSFGMKQRLGIAAALLGDPRLLILDEPINGLDPAGVHEMRGLIGRLASGGRTVLVSSHVLAELEQVCDWLIVIDDGRLVFQGPAAELLDQSGARLVVAPEHPGDLDRLRDAARRRGPRRRARATATSRSPSTAPIRAASRRTSTARPGAAASSSPSCASPAPASRTAT